MAGPYLRRRVVLAAATAAVAAAVVIGVRGCEPPAPVPSSSLPAENGTSSRPAGRDNPLDLPSHPQTETGAADAAAAYLELMRRATVDSSLRSAALERIAAPGDSAVAGQAAVAFAAVDALVAQARQQTPHAGLVVWQVPVAWTVDSYTATAAVVRVWSLGVVAVEGWVEATETWQTTTLELVWTGDDWRVRSWNSTPGPVPHASNRLPTPTGELLSTVATWERYHHAAKN